MKKDIPVGVVIAIVVVVVLVVAGLYWRSWTRQEESKPPVMTGPIKLPPSQVGTKLGGQTLGETYGGTAPQPPTRR